MSERKITARQPGWLWLPESGHVLNIGVSQSVIILAENDCRVYFRDDASFTFNHPADVAAIRAYLLREEEAPPVDITGGMDSVEYVGKIRRGEPME